MVVEQIFLNNWLATKNDQQIPVKKSDIKFQVFEAIFLKLTEQSMKEQI